MTRITGESDNPSGRRGQRAAGVGVKPARPGIIVDHMGRKAVLWVLAAALTLGARASTRKKGPELRQLEAAGLRYLVVVVGKADPDAKMPMVVFLHGRGDRPRVPDDGWYGLDRPVRLVLPVAPDRLGEGFTWLPYSVTEGHTAELTDAVVDRSDQLARFLEAVTSRHPTVGQPIVSGFSQGGILTYAVATRHPGAVGEAYPLAGWLPPGAMPTARVRASDRPPPIRAMHGTADPIVRLGPTVHAVGGLRRLGWDVELVEFPGAGHEMTPPMQRRYGRWLRAAADRAALKVERRAPASGPGV